MERNPHRDAQRFKEILTANVNKIAVNQINKSLKRQKREIIRGLTSILQNIEILKSKMDKFEHHEEVRRILIDEIENEQQQNSERVEQQHEVETNQVIYEQSTDEE